MADNDLPYNRSLDALESLLAGVKRPGDFWVSGVLALPSPMVEVAGVGLLPFPLPPAQIAALTAAAERAPYGRGEKTVLDTSVRRVWQIDAREYRRQCRQHDEDIAAMRALQALAVAPDAQERARLAAAVARQPQAVEG